MRRLHVVPKILCHAAKQFAIPFENGKAQNARGIGFIHITIHAPHISKICFQVVWIDGQMPGLFSAKTRPPLFQGKAVIRYNAVAVFLVFDPPGYSLWECLFPEARDDLPCLVPFHPHDLVEPFCGIGIGINRRNPPEHSFRAFRCGELFDVELTHKVPPRSRRLPGIHPQEK